MLPSAAASLVFIVVLIPLICEEPEVPARGFQLVTEASHPFGCSNTDWATASSVKLDPTLYYSSLMHRQYLHANSWLTATALGELERHLELVRAPAHSHVFTVSDPCLCWEWWERKASSQWICVFRAQETELNSIFFFFLHCAPLIFYRF